MSKNPFINSLVAILYILLLVLAMDFGSKVSGPQTGLMMPVAMVSLFTLSAAVMAYLFCYQPFQLYFAGKKKEAIKLFLQTVGVFGAITILIFVLIFFRIIR